jgi:cytochrome oxidase assembly protein ShyY1
MSTIGTPDPSTAHRPTGSVAGRLAFLSRPGWLSVILGAVVFAALCYLVLAPWQFSRHEQRSAQNASIAAAIDAPPQPLEQRLPAGDGVAADEVWQQATATGSFLPDRQVAVRLRQDGNGRPASEILAALQLSDGSILVVDRGFIPIGGLADNEPPPPPPAGPVTVTGRLQPFQPDPLNRPPVRTGNRIDVLGISATSITDLPGPVRDGFIQLVGGSPGVLAPISVPQMDSGPYLSYAWQWLAFGTMGLLAVGFFCFREFTDPREPATDEAAPTASPGRRKSFDRSSLYDSP